MLFPRGRSSDIGIDCGLRSPGHLGLNTLEY